MLMLLVFLVSSIYGDIPHPSDLPTVLYSQEGDLNIGIIVPMHYSSSSSMCSPNIRGLTNFQKAEAMAFAVKEINDRDDILPNTTLGFFMLDDCAKDTTAMARALHFTQTNNGRHNEDHLQAYDVVGVIGAESSRNSVQIADLLSLFQIPVISYISTSPALSDKDTYPFFSRIVPSDSLQMSVLMDIIIKFDWNYVSVVYEDGSYGYGAYKVFEKLMDKNKKCIAVATVFKKRVPDEEVDGIINGLISKSRARIVVLIVTTPDVIRIFQSITRLNREGYFTWLGTDGWSFKSLTGYEKYMQGSLLVGFYGTYVERFDQYMKYLTPKNSTHNPWFREFFEKRLSCKYGVNSSCNLEENLLDGYLPSVLSGFAMDAVYAFARGLHNIIKNCGQTETKTCVTGHKLLQYIRNLSFEGEHGLVSFDNNGDGSVTYSVKTLRKENGGYSQETIGLWDTFSRSFVKLDSDRITWKSDETLPPISECSEFCQPGYQAVKTKPRCCWYCKPCRVNERSVEVNKSMTCVVCPVFSWPDDTKTNCRVIPVTDLSYSKVLGIALTLIVTILCLVIIALLTLYLKNRKTLVHQNRILTYFIMIANLVSCGSIIAFVVPPALFSCSLIQFAFPLNFAINYCPFLVKTYGIFEMIKNNNGQTGPESGRVVPMFVLLLLVQVLIVIVTTSINPPLHETTMPDIYEEYVESACNLDQVGFMASLSYNLILLFICIYFTVRSKNVNADANLIRDIAGRIYRPSSLSSISFSQPGDWNIGVVIPAHEFSETSMCSRIPRRLTNLKKIEAIKFAVDEINERKDILPNTTLGFYIVDDCSKDTTAMMRALHFTQTLKVIKEHSDELRSYDVIGVIGAESSRNSVQIADLLSLFEIPVISYVSTSPLLSDKNKYPFFSRIVPSDSLQVSVLMDIIIKFNWNYVSIVYEDGSYGNEIYKAFKNLMNKNKKCLAVSRVVRGELTQEKAEQIIKALKSADGARAVVLVLVTSDAVKIFKTVKRLGYSNHFTWLGTDGWGSNINDYKDVEDVTVGSLTIGFHGVFVDRLDNYIKHLTPANATYNPWFNEFFERNYDCRFETNGNETKCDRRKNLSEGYAQSFMPGFVMDAVYAYAYSLDTALPNCGDVDIKDCIKGKRFLNIIRNTSFKGDNGIVAFDEFGDGESTYVIRSLREVNGGYELTEIGRWDTGIRSFTHFNTQNITWTSGFSNSAHPPISQCSKDCPPGFEAILTKPQCCWYCKRCHNNERSVMIDQKLTCDVCPVFTWPDDSKTGCAPIIVSKISYDNAIGISIMIVVIIMVSGTITCIVLYNNKINNHNSRNRELDYLIASGILVSNIVPVAFLISPSESSCHVIHFGFQLSFTLVYSPFLLKAYKIFHADKTISVLGEEIPETPVRNVIYYGLVICIGMIVVILCAVTYPVRWETTMPDLNEAYVESTCQIEENGILIPAAYNVFILLIATMLIIRSRNARPSICSANECKFNNICGYTSIVLWLGFSVSYFTTSKSVILSVIICISMLGNASVFLCLLILPKLHDVYFPTMDHNRREDRQATALTCK